MAADTYSAKGGGIAAAVAASWSRTAPARAALDWMPRIDTPVLTAEGRFRPEWHRFLSEVARRLGGPQGSSVTDIVGSLSQVQLQVSATTDIAQSAAASAQAASISIAVIREVAIAADLPGAGEIP